jgi:hypothetical protein
MTMVAVQEGVSTVRRLALPPGNGNALQGIAGTGGRHRAVHTDQSRARPRSARSLRLRRIGMCLCGRATWPKGRRPMI